MGRRGSALVVATVCLLAACSSGEGDVAETTSVTRTVASSIDVPATTNVPTTSESPTTTIDPAAALAAEVEADFREAVRLTNVGFQDPTDEAKVAAALSGYVGSNRGFIEERFREFASNGWATVLHPSVQAGLAVEEPARLIGPGSDLVEMQVCEIDPWIVVEVGAGPNGMDAVVNSEIVAYRSVFFLRAIDGRWRVEGSQEIGTWSGVETCPER